jgi:type I restriction enzyme S subunit
MRDGWVETTLGEIAEVIDPHPSHRAPAVDENGIPFIGIGDLRKTGDIDFAKARRVSREILEEHKARYDRSEFLIGLGRVASIGMVVRLPDESIDYVVSPTLAVIKAREVIGQFLFYLLEGPHSQEQFQRFKKGSTRESVGMQILRKIKVRVPPLSEQKRIVDLISSVDAYIEALQQQLESVKRSRNAVLHQLLSVGGDEWETTTIGEISDFVSTRKSPGQLPSDSVYVGLEHLEPNNTSIDNFESISKVTSSLTPFDVGDVLFGRLRPYLHKVVIAEMFGFCSPEILVLRANSKVLPQMLLLFCDADSTIRICVERSAGTRMPRTSTEDLASIEIKLPPMAEQIKLAELFSTFDTDISQLSIALEKSKILRSGLLSDVLSGEHEIPASYDKVMGAA